jgi:hypothetical protein
MGDHFGAAPDRRGFILGTLGALALGPATVRAATGATGAGSAGAAALDLADPASALAAMLRLQGRIDGRDAPWWYFGRIYGVVGDSSPRLLVRFEGLEIMRLTPAAPGEYAATGVTTSFFQDPATKAVLETFANPYTGRTNVVTPNMIGGTANPITFYSAKGVRPGRVAPADWKPDGLHLTWDFHGESVWLAHDRVYPPGLPQPMGEASVARAKLADLADARRGFVPASFSSTYFAPFPKWMDMSGQPGHVIWHADGIKLDTVADLPPDFRARVEKLFPERLKALPYQPAA